MDDIKKNELNEQEMENVSGGFFTHAHPSNTPNRTPVEPSAFDKAMDEFVGGVCETAVDAYNAVSEAGDIAWKVVKNVFDDMF